MIYASDLDGTLIFPQNFLSLHYCDDEIFAVEDGKDKSYMSRLVHNKLIELSNVKNLRIVPVTMRSKYEYDKLSLKAFNIEYSITSNGGRIYKNNNILDSWKEEVQDNIDFIHQYRIMSRLTYSGYFRNINIVDDSFIMARRIGKSLEIENEIINEILDTYKEYRLNLWYDKVYLIPDIVKKGNALNHLRKVLEEDVVMACGDSDLDIDMLEVADIKVVPDHTTISSDKLDSIGDVVTIGGGVLSPLYAFEMAKNYANTY